MPTGDAQLDRTGGAQGRAAAVPGSRKSLPALDPRSISNTTDAKMTMHSPILSRVLLLVAVFASAVCAGTAAHAQQLGIDIVGGNASALPIAVVPLPYQGGGCRPRPTSASVVRTDLAAPASSARLPRRDIVERPTAAAEVNYPDLAPAEAGFPRRRPGQRTPATAATASNTNCSTSPSSSACSASR